MGGWGRGVGVGGLESRDGVGGLESGRLELGGRSRGGAGGGRVGVRG